LPPILIKRFYSSDLPQWNLLKVMVTCGHDHCSLWSVDEGPPLPLHQSPGRLTIIFVMSTRSLRGSLLVFAPRVFGRRAPQLQDEKKVGMAAGIGRPADK
jgi:hypothetical protein